MNQIAYDTPMLFNQGDTLETICTYDAPAQFGNGTNQEMCYDFITAWPAGALAGGAGSRDCNLAWPSSNASSRGVQAASRRISALRPGRIQCEL
jgi:hypothetical protein